MTFGEKLKYIREELLRMTQQELASSIKSTQGTVNALESGKNKTPSYLFMQGLVLIHNVNPMYLFKEDSNEPAILIQDGKGNRPLLKKIAQYERIILQLNKIMSGKNTTLLV